jgi:hypothetical protein
MSHTVLGRLRGCRGAELVELALVLPLLLFVLAGIMDFGLLFQHYLVVNNAAREGARIAVLPGYAVSDVQNRAQDYVREGVGDPAAVVNTTVVDVTIDPPGATPSFPAKQVTVQATYQFLLLGPIAILVGGGPFGEVMLTGRSTMRVEG